MIASLMSIVLANSAAQKPPFDGFIDDPLLATDAEIPDDNPNWVYFKTSAYCYAADFYKTGRFVIGLDRRRDILHLSFVETPAPTSSTAKEFDIRIVAVRRAGGDEYGDIIQTERAQPFYSRINEDNETVYSTAIYAHQWLDTISSYDHILFYQPGGAIKLSYPLTGSAKAIGYLKTCTPGSEK